MEEICLVCEIIIHIGKLIGTLAANEINMNSIDYCINHVRVQF